MKRRNNKTIIGLILEDINCDFSKELIKSVLKAIPENKNIRLIVFPGKYGNEQDSFNQHAYKIVYNSVLNLSRMCSLDGLIIHLGSVSEKEKAQLFKEYLTKYSNISKVFIAQDTDQFITVNYDNESGIREALNCVINANGLNRICMLGGRDDNRDSMLRKNIFSRCLSESGIPFTDANYQKTDMSPNCVEEAGRLLDRNPEAEAIFCVNDAVAIGLYEAMNQRGLTPGKDIVVFGFDNTQMAGEMVPPLSSIGSYNSSLGQKAMELLLRKMNGDKVSSALVPTRLYGRGSLNYEMYDYNGVEMEKADPAFIYRMFDDCFYRYINEHIDRENINLKRLFFEFISRILKAVKKRYISVENYNEISKLIDVFFAKGAMEYTDAAKFIRSIERLQSSLNSTQRSPSVRLMVNHLFAGMRDKAICSIAERRSNLYQSYLNEHELTRMFLVENMNFQSKGEDNTDNILRRINRLGLKNAAVFTFKDKLLFNSDIVGQLPEYTDLRCVMKSGDFYMLPKERQNCSAADIFARDELSQKCRGYAAFPIFYCEYIFGLLLCELTADIYTTGELIALQLGSALYMNDIQNESHKEA